MHFLGARLSTAVVSSGGRRRFFRAREREAKKEREKSESAERERKKARIRAFSSTLSGNPVSEPKAARQGEKQRL